MATHVCGIDLGSYAVKVAVLAPGFRASTLVALHEARVPSGPEPALERAAVVARQLIVDKNLGDLPIYVAIPGHKVFIHVLEFPFKSLRRAELEAAVGAELEAVLPIDLEDMVFSFEPLPRAAISKEAALAEVGDDAPTSVRVAAPVGRVAPATEGMRVLACAMQKEKARTLLSALEAAGAPPRGMLAAPASYGQVARKIVGLKTTIPGRVGAALIDIGHERTDVCVLTNGRVDFVRTIARGGRALTESIAKQWNLDFTGAEAAKHKDGFIGSGSEPPASEAWQRIHDALLPEMEHLVRELKRTVSACRAKTGVTIEKAVLVGGCSRLRGIASFLAERLGLPVSVLSDDEAQTLLGPRSEPIAVDTGLLALGVGMEAATGRPQFDLRAGDLAFKADLSFLRERIGQLVAAVLVVVAFAAASGYMAHYKLRKAEKTLTERLAVESTKAFGSALDEEQVLERIEPGTSSTRNPIPEMTAYDIFLEINNHMPARDKVKIDIRDLDIKDDKITIKATAFPTESGGALQGIEAVEAELKKSKCFKELTQGESQPGADDTRDFSMTIKSSC